MTDRIELELDTSAELLLKAMAGLGWAGLFVLCCLYAVRQDLDLVGPLMVTAFLAVSLSVLSWALRELYVLDLEGRRLLYCSRFFGQVREQQHPFEEIAASSLLTTGRLSAPCLLTRSGTVLRVGDFSLQLGASRLLALQLSDRIGCPFQEPASASQPSLGERAYLAWSLALAVWFALLALLLLRT